jgi:hypothetical protein
MAPDMQPPTGQPTDVTANTTDGSRDGNDGREATGGNVR